MNSILKTLPSRLPRMSGWLLITAVLLALVWLVAPQQLPVSLYKLSLVTLAALVGYWLDRSLFPYARPDVFMAQEVHSESVEDAGPAHPIIDLEALSEGALTQLTAIAMLRRAIVVGCCMLSMGLGA